MVIIKIGICLSYFIIGGLATTNIMRLLKGSELPVLSSDCHCDNCGMTITPLNQMPIVSYIACHGHCRKCKIKLPTDALILEIVVFIGMSLISFAGNFSMLSVVFSFLYYEFIRIVYLFKYGHREKLFIKQYIVAVIAMVGFLIMVEFMAFLLKAIN